MKIAFFFAAALIFSFTACTGHITRMVSAQPTATMMKLATPIASIDQNELVTPTRSSIRTEDRAMNRAVEDGRLVAARVNNQPVFLDTYQKQLAQIEQALRSQDTDLTSRNNLEILAQARRQVLEGLIDQLIIKQEADRLQIQVTDQELEVRIQAEIGQQADQTQLDEWLAANNLTFDEFKHTLRAQLIAQQLFEQLTKDIPETAEQAQVRHIQVADESTARLIIDQLKSGRDFTVVAQEYSVQDNAWNKPEQPRWIAKGLGMLPAQVENTAFSLQPGQMNGPIPTPGGFYILELLKWEAKRPLTEEMAQAWRSQIYAGWLKEQRSLAVIERFVDQ
jgi:parvulin-like peptidyl-prolyl isomerase